MRHATQYQKPFLIDGSFSFNFVQYIISWGEKQPPLGRHVKSIEFLVFK